MRQVQESPTDYQEEYEYANPSHHCRDNVPQKPHLTEPHISKKSSVLKLGAEQFQVQLYCSFQRPLRRFQPRHQRGYDRSQLRIHSADGD
jgi:hypothetical protein